MPVFAQNRKSAYDVFVRRSTAVISMRRKKLGAKKVDFRDMHHARVFYDENMYAGHPNLARYVMCIKA